jgi:DNA-binding CsgD family transcriptional regulator
LGNFYYIRKRILKTRLREKLRHEKRLAQREKMFKEQTALSEKEIMHLRNESLRNEMKFKNKELANATLHLIQKNKTLTYLREDLTRLIKNIPSDSPEKQNVNNLLKKINKDLKNEKGWELFNSYFDEVHQDFIGRLKDRYPDLTPKELRLCAYLKMNISTKEIAPLMNISVRGVEISRYRLRKKLQLDHNANLTEFLISF